MDIDALHHELTASKRFRRALDGAGICARLFRRVAAGKVGLTRRMAAALLYRLPDPPACLSQNQGGVTVFFVRADLADAAHQFFASQQINQKPPTPNADPQ